MSNNVFKTPNSNMSRGYDSVSPSTRNFITPSIGSVSIPKMNLFENIDSVPRSNKLKSINSSLPSNPFESKNDATSIKSLNRPKIYCGNQEQKPNGYDKLGTRYDCLRKGFGAAMYKVPIEKIQKARTIDKTNNVDLRFGNKNLQDQEIIQISNILNISLKDPTGKTKDKKTLLLNVIRKLSN